MSDNIVNMPTGSIGAILILSENVNVHYGYDINSEIVGSVHSNEEYYVYKVIDNWHLIGNHQWVFYDGKDLIFDKDSVFKVIPDVLPEQTPIIDEEYIIIAEEKQDDEQSDNVKNPTNNFIKKIGKIFGRK